MLQVNQLIGFGASPGDANGGNDAYTKLLLHFDNNLTDSSASGHTMTNSGTSFGTSPSAKFGSHQLTATGTYITSDTHNDFELGAVSGNTNDFTFDFWFYNGATAYPFFGFHPGSTFTAVMYFAGVLYASSDNASWDIANGVAIGTPPGGQWNHFALVRNGNAWATYMNGTQQATFTSSATPYVGTKNMSIGYSQTTAGNGYYDEFRFSKGIARWTSNFTPPTSPYF